MNNTQYTYTGRASSVQINGTVVRLAFSSEKNAEAAAIVRDILKGAYLRSQTAQWGRG